VARLRGAAGGAPLTVPRRAVPAALALALACATAGTAAVRRPVAGQPSFPDLDRSYQQPRPEDPLCLGAQLEEKMPPQREGRVVVKFPVDASGKGGDVTILADTVGVDPKVFQAVEESIRVCKWAPGQDPQGRTVQVIVVLPIVFTKASPPAR
jgi:hypothetical protein